MLAGLVVILLFVVILLVVQLSHAQMAMLRHMTGDKSWARLAN